MKSTLVLIFILFCVSLYSMADIQVDYVGFTTEQQAAFEHAISIWEPILSSAVPIKIHATLQTIPGFVVITLPNLIHNFNGAPIQNVWYSTALANAITATDLNPTEADVDFIINPTQPWYYGLDGNCPTASIDFVTEMMKATAYGLGYQSSFYVQQGFGSYGMIDPSVLGLSTSFVWEPMQNMPALYDTFICNTQAQYLTNTALFPNPSPALNAQLTGGSLRYHGLNAMNYNLGEEPVLYASGFNLARTARLLAATYDGTENAPGVPTAYNGQVLHYPAPIVLGMLQDQGWNMDFSSLLLGPTSLQATVEQGSVYLSWDAPDTPYVIHNYVIYRDGAQIGTAQSASYTDLGLVPGTYSYTVETTYSFGGSLPSDPLSVQVPVAVEDETAIPGAELAISLAPNPFSGSSRLSLNLKDAGMVSIKVFDLKGRKVGDILNAYHNGGTFQYTWDGTDGKGKRLASGIYLIKAESMGRSNISKALIIK